MTDLTAPGKVIQLGCEPSRIDLMTSITGVTFEDAWETRVSGELDGVSVLAGSSALDDRCQQSEPCGSHSYCLLSPAASRAAVAPLIAS